MKNAPQFYRTVQKIFNISIFGIVLVIIFILSYCIYCYDLFRYGISETPGLAALLVLNIILACLIVLKAVLSRKWIFGREDASAAKLKREVALDDLTSVYNRRALMKYVHKIEPESDYTVLLMNVDKFKDINEVYGYDFGDHVLQVIADELVNYMKAFQGFVARYGSDEFLIIFRGVKLSESSDAITHMRDIIHEPIKIGLASIIPTVCIGAAYSDGFSPAEEVVSRAEIAERAAKRIGRKSFVIFSEEMQKQVEEASDIRQKIKEAIADDGFYMLYQPKVRVRDQKVVGYEALVRMKKYSISPALFIPIAEENGWLREIGRITTEKTIQQIAYWRSQYPDYDLPVSINFSSIQIRDGGYLYFFLDTLAKYGVPANLVEIEITERIML